MVGQSANEHSDQQLPEVGTLDTSKITQLIQRTRLLLRTTWLATGTGVTLGLLLATLVAVSLIDLLVYTLPPWLRLTGLLCIVIPTLWVCFLGVIRPLCRRLTEVIVARHIEREIPGIHNRLISCIDLARNGSTETGIHSQAFHVRLVNEALSRIADFSPRKVLDLISLRKSTVFAVVTTMILVVAFAGFGDRLSTAVARIVYFYRDIPPNSGVDYRVVTGDRQKPGNDQTLRGEDVQFTVTVTKGHLGLLKTDALTLEVETTDKDGNPTKLVHEFPELKEVPGVADATPPDQTEAGARQTSFSLVGMQRDFRYRVRGGQTWTPQFQVTMLERPRIVGLQTVLHYPDYMRIAEPRYGAPQTKDVTGPKGSKVEVVVEVEGDVEGGEIVLLEPRLTRVAITDRPERERIWFSDALPSGATAEGTWQWDQKTTGRQGHFDAPAAGPHAHGFSGVPVGYQIQPDEVLFAKIWVVDGQAPEQIMLQWNDGENWEHRAFWGADKIAEGTLGTPSRHALGALPQTGGWVTLEVPADAVGLTGKRIKGMRFRLVGGHCIWGATGTLPPTDRLVRKLVPTERFPVKRLTRDAAAPEPASSDSGSGSGSAPPATAVADAKQSRWSGTFDLLKDGYYRVELRNQAGYPNQSMEEGKLDAIVDEAPWVEIERPGIDLVVSTPVKVPIFLRASDDYGIAEVELAVQKGEEEAFQGRPVQSFDQPPRSVTQVVTLDLAEEALAVGASLKYRIVVRDGKGSSATSRDYTIRLADESQAADKQFEQYETQTDTFQEKLVKLIAEQDKIRESTEQLVEKYEPLTEKLEAAAAEAKQEVDPADPQAKPAPLKLDEETAKQRDELRGELTQLAAQENKNVELGQQVANDLKQLAEQANNQAFLPPEITRQLEAMQEAFQELAVEPMQQLATQAQAAAQPQEENPPLENLQQQSEQVQKNLDDLQNRLEALADAQTESRTDAETALADLRRELMQQDAQLTASDLAELRDFLEAKRADLDTLQGSQEELLEDATKDLSERGFEAIEDEQTQLDVDSEEELDSVRDLLEQLREMKDPPQFPGKPYDPEQEGYKVPPKEQDTAEPEDGKKQADQAPEPAGEADEGEAEEEDPELFLPALGGPVPEMDERFADKLRDLKEQVKQADERQTDKEDRKEMRSRQVGRVEELDQAQRALGADKNSLEKLLEQLENLANQSNQSMSPSQKQQLDKQMQEQMRSRDMQAAREMMQRLQQMLGQAGAPQDQAPEGQQPPQSAPPPPPSPSTLSEAANATAVVDAIVEELGDFDASTRTVIIGMQKRQREDLLQSLKSKGPEGYRAFVREYFRKLAKVKGE